MKTGRTLAEISKHIHEEAQAKRDYVADSSQLVAVPRSGGFDIEFSVNGEPRVYTPTELCMDQIAERTGIPGKYAARMREESPELLATNVNHWFSKRPEKRMLRTLNGEKKVARAFLSNAYRPLDNYDLLNAVLPHAAKLDCRVQSCEVTDRRLYIQMVTPRLEAVIQQELKLGNNRIVNRTIQAGVVVSNSEIGSGSIKVEPMLFDLFCTNGMILTRTLRKSHVGRRNEGAVIGDADTFELVSDTTRQLDDKAFWSRVNDVVAAAFDSIRFDENIGNLRAAQSQTLGKTMKDAERIVEVTAKRFDLTGDESQSVLLHLAQGGDLSAFGLGNAVTRAAEDAESYDRCIDLERFGGQVIALKPSDFALN